MCMDEYGLALLAFCLSLCSFFLRWYGIFAPICVAMEILRIQVGKVKVLRNQNADVSSL